MNRLLLFALLICATLATESCIIKDKKGKSDIQVIELDDDSSKESSESEILALHLPDRRRREVDSHKKVCTKDEDCGPGKVCLAHLTCVKGTRRTVNSPEAKAAN